MSARRTQIFRGTDGATVMGLSPSLLARIRQRAGSAALTYALVQLAVTPILAVAHRSRGEDVLLPLLIVCALSFLAWLDTKFSPLPDKAFLLGVLIYEFGLCISSAWSMTAFSLERTGSLPLMTWAEPTIIFFGVMIPLPATASFVNATICGLARTGVIFWFAHTGAIELEPLMVVESSIPTIMAIVFATVGSRLVHGLSMAVDRAERMGSYRLTERVGAGAMGEVWVAQHSLLRRPAAIKLIRAEMLDSMEEGPVIERFEREAQATAALTSSHTVRLYDFGRAEDGAFYYVMELLDGVDLRTLVERHGPLPAERVVHLTRQICDSLAEAHLTGMVHRDIKPANIYTCRYGRHIDYAKVLDFGLVTQQQTKQLTMRADAQVTANNTTVGTPAFMAPEMVVSAPVDGRADLYSLGGVMFWLLSGRLVFEEESAMAAAVAHASQVAPLVSTVTELEVPPALDQIVARLLAKRPEDRFARAEDLADALDGLSLESPWTTQRAGTWWSKHGIGRAVADPAASATLGPKGHAEPTIRKAAAP